MAWLCLTTSHSTQIKEIQAAEKEDPSPLPGLTSWQHLPCFTLLSPFDKTWLHIIA